MGKYTRLAFAPQRIYLPCILPGNMDKVGLKSRHVLIIAMGSALYQSKFNSKALSVCHLIKSDCTGGHLISLYTCCKQQSMTGKAVANSPPLISSTKTTWAANLKSLKGS